jgi:isopentenyldiphosphate isomerase
MNNVISQKEEWLDVVDDNDVVIGLGSRYDIHKIGLPHREVHVWLFDESKNLYFQKSPAHKSSAGLYDASIGGHVDKGEDYLTAAIRETKEESGLTLDPVDLVLVNKLRGRVEHKTKGTINDFFRSIYVYKIPVQEKDIKIDPKETDGLHKFSLDYLLNLSNEESLKFHKLVPTNELPFVLNYVKSM